MKRLPLSAALLVLALVIAGVLAERAGSSDPFAARLFAAPRRIPFEPLVAPFGQLELSGTVVTHEGQPAAGVVIHLHSPEASAENALPLAWTFTNDEGRFLLRGLARATYVAILLQPGYPHLKLEVALPRPEPVQWILPAPLPPIEAMPDMVRGPVLGRLAPPVSAPTWPVEGHEVVFRPAADGTLLSGATTRRVLTDAAGDFRVPDLVVARYDVQVLPLWASGGDWPVLDEVSFQHGEALDDLLLLRLRCGEIGGRLFDRAGRPVEGAVVQTHPTAEPGRLWPATTTDAEGRFVVSDLPFGAYDVQLQAGGWSWTGAAEVRIGTRVEVTPATFEPASPKPASPEPASPEPGASAPAQD